MSVLIFPYQLTWYQSIRVAKSFGKFFLNTLRFWCIRVPFFFDNPSLKLPYSYRRPPPTGSSQCLTSAAPPAAVRDFTFRHHFRLQPFVSSLRRLQRSANAPTGSPPSRAASGTVVWSALPPVCFPLPFPVVLGFGLCLSSLGVADLPLWRVILLLICICEGLFCLLGCLYISIWDYGWEEIHSCVRYGACDV